MEELVGRNFERFPTSLTLDCLSAAVTESDFRRTRSPWNNAVFYITRECGYCVLFCLPFGTINQPALAINRDFTHGETNVIEILVRGGFVLRWSGFFRVSVEH